MTAARFRPTSPDQATVELYRDAMFGIGAAPSAGITTTYQIVSDGTIIGLHPRSEPSMSSPGFQQWLRRQHPADVVRIILMLAAVGAVILAIVRLG